MTSASVERAESARDERNRLSVDDDWSRLEQERVGQLHRGVFLFVSEHPGVLRVRARARELALSGDVDGALALIDRLAGGYTEDLERRPVQARRLLSTSQPSDAGRFHVRASTQLDGAPGARRRQAATTPPA